MSTAVATSTASSPKHMDEENSHANFFNRSGKISESVGGNKQDVMRPSQDIYKIETSRSIRADEIAANSVLQDQSDSVSPLHQETDSNLNPCTTTLEQEVRSSKQEVPSHSSSFPSDLLQILQEVAKSGTCAWLPWNECKETRISFKDSDATTTFYRHSSFSTYQYQQQSLQQQQPRSGGKRHHLHNGVLGAKRTRVGSSKRKRQHYYSGGSGAAATTTTAHSTGNNSVINTTTVGVHSDRAGSTSARAQYRNGLHPHPPTNRRYVDAGLSPVRKHSLYLIHTSSNLSNSSTLFSPGSVGSGRTSGSEPEESSQYECDSEGTSATSNSEVSFEVHGGSPGTRVSEIHKRNTLLNKALKSSSSKNAEAGHPTYNSLKDVFYKAISIVMDHFYENRGGYKLSNVEKQRQETLNNSQSSETTAVVESKKTSLYKLVDEESTDNDINTSLRKSMMPEGFSTLNGLAKTSKENKIHERSLDMVYQQRKESLLNMLGCTSKVQCSPSSSSFNEPPFTIQRIAEVLISPDRYYTQTHKLCNCLEKLLLVTSSANAFGGSSGGDTTKTLLEEKEVAALVDEKQRRQFEHQQSLHRSRHTSRSPMNEGPVSMDTDDGCAGEILLKVAPIAEKSDTQVSLGESGLRQRANSSAYDSDEDRYLHASEGQSGSREVIEAAARASLRSKFDHVGIDPHSSVVNNRDVRAIVESRGMTNSPPPPGITSAPGIAVAVGHTGLLRFHPSSPTSPTDRDQPLRVRPHSPLLYTTNNDGSSSPPIAPLLSNPSNIHLLQLHGASTMSGMSPLELFHSSVSGFHAPSPGQGLSAKETDIETRSSASSDVDSESDVSFDDSASDRSDGSDSGQHYEPALSAARAMALNRIQQQQRLQSRVLTSLQPYNGGGVGGGILDTRPPSEAEYQSGDSIDSMRAEDSGGSDSSSSDVAD